MFQKDLHNQALTPIVLLGGSGSGKTALALEIAREFPCVILSLDSLSVYQEIDIVSAKPSKESLLAVKHFGINCISPAQKHSVVLFTKTFEEARECALKERKNLLIVGGSGFYLRSLLYGMSPLPKISEKVSQNVKDIIVEDLEYAYRLLVSVDNETKIKPTDTYRISKSLEIYFATQTPPSIYFRENPPIPTITKAHLLEITLPKEALYVNIQKRTQNMLDSGLIEEIMHLKQTYGVEHFWAKSIGIREGLEFLKGQIKTQEVLKEQIATHTMQLAKRQKTFNKTQYPKHLLHIRNSPQAIQEWLRRELFDRF